ncbi:RrF2 family transcriptional regulator [Paraburkholderia caribensis]|uniref:RrF2 family transcriptional regulator n=1 Tax=Paraburkholderia caribensis TaxID=75105 RepID=UPI0007200C5E|nr:Rrf2 family transcriptional regulator [Paraburkholderia caribensis]ALP65129.1 transcriptional regulator [Paraburkholderia caribensis]AUT53722.1 Rrf2 family transcriptional regulator [Paraburkholderia caribensis]
MSHISAGVEYGLHCLLFLTEAAPGGVPEASVRDLAELQGVPADYVAKLFTKLHKAGLVIATEGAKGGFALARPANQISVLDVVTAIDGDKSLFECREVRTRCAVFGETAPNWATSGVCSIHAVMQNAEKRMREALASQSLEDLAVRTTAKAPRSYGPQVVKWLDGRTTSRRRERGSSRGGSTPGARS